MNRLKNFWLFGDSSLGLNGKKKLAFWAWNTAVLLAAGLCLGMLSIFFAYGDYTDMLMKSYLQRPLLLLLNVAPVVVLVLLLYLLTGRPWAAFLLSSVLVWGLSLGNYYKLRFRDDPLMFEDLKYLREAGSITKTASYDLTPDKRVWFGLACVVLGTVFLLFLVRGIPKWRVRLPLFLVGALLCVPAWKCYADKDLYNTRTANYDYINRWSSTQVYISKGFVYPFLHSVSVGSIKAPGGYSERETAALLDSYVLRIFRRRKRWISSPSSWRPLRISPGLTMWRASTGREPMLSTTPWRRRALPEIS